MLAPEDPASTLAGKLLDDVYILAAAVIAFARVAFSILIGEDRTRGRQYRLGNEVLRRDHFEIICDAALFVGDCSCDFRIDFGKRSVDVTGHPRLSLLEAVSTIVLQIAL
jgi:hypothetical protein